MMKTSRWCAILALTAGLACGDDDSGADAGTTADAGATADAGGDATDAGTTAEDAGMGGSAESRAYCERIQATQQQLATTFGECAELISLIALETEADLVACSLVVDGCMADSLTWYETFNDTVATCTMNAPTCTAAEQVQWSTTNLDACAQQAVLAAGPPPWGNDPSCGLAP